MGRYHLKLPKMGESVVEATVTKWLKQIGEKVSIDDPILEIATDKIDTDVISEVDGVIIEHRFKENEVVQIGDVLVVIEIDGEVKLNGMETDNIEVSPNQTNEEEQSTDDFVTVLEEEIENVNKVVNSSSLDGNRFYSPLVRNIAKKEGISHDELDLIPGTGKDQRLTKSDLLNYLKMRRSQKVNLNFTYDQKPISETHPSKNSLIKKPNFAGQDQVIEMTRMEKLISKHRRSSLETSAHVQSFIEVDVTHLWDWREQIKNSFLKQENEKLTFTPLFMTAIIKALRDFPNLNSIVEGDKIVIKKDINLGMATSLPDGNLIVPVIKNADHLNLVGLTKAVNDLASRARKNSLKPEEVQDGTYTLTNIGNFGSIMGTPIINQPQVGILAIGVIRKMPAVIETPKGDFIGIRRKLILSHSYDHRIINGATGGLFIKSIAEYLENWNKKLPY